MTKFISMTTYLQRVFLIAFIFLGLNYSQATHNLGGEITWECRANGNYDFTVVYYRRCAGASAPSSANISYPGGSFSLSFSSASDVTPKCPSGSASRSCSSRDEGAIEQNIYEAKNVALSGTPAAGGWVFEWNASCCRPSTPLINTTENSFSLRAVMYPYTPPGATQPNNLSQCYDSSPNFQQPANVVTCMGFKYVFNHLASDTELDSLSYSFTDPWDGSGNPISFSAGYSSTAPLPDQTENAANGPVVLDPVSGELTFEVISGDTMWYAQAIAIDAWRCGQKIATIVRDVPVYLIDNCPVNPQAPSAEIDTSVYTNVSRNGNTYTVNTFPQDTVRFQITSQDLIPNSLGLFPNITFEANGSQVPRKVSNYSSGTGCNGAAPCAKFISDNVPPDYVNPGTNKVTFEWVPDCVHLNFGNCGSATNTYRFTMKMSDDGCPAPRIGLATVIVNVLSGDPTPVNVTSAKTDTAGNVELTWEKAKIDSALDFNYYLVYGASNVNGPYSVVDSIANDIDSTVTRLSGQSVPAYYYMVKSTGACDFISRPSDTIYTMNMNLTATPSGGARNVALSWTPLMRNFNDSYEIWMQTPPNIGPWQQIGSTTSLSYNTVINVCDDSLNFEIRVPDTAHSVFSASTREADLFKDNINNEIVSVDSVTIKDSLLHISWNPPNSGDIFTYMILFNDSTSGWIPVDTVSIFDSLPYAWEGSKAHNRPEEIKLVAVDTCGNQSDDQRATVYKAPFLSSDLNTCENFVQLDWEKAIELGTGIAGYRVLATILDENGDTLNPSNLLGVTDAVTTEFKHNNLVSDWTYIYRVRAFDTTGNFTSTSNAIGINANVSQNSELLYISKVSNDQDRDALNIQFYIDPDADVDRFELQRAPDQLGPYKQVSILNKPDNPPFIINFTDFGVDRRNQDYYYRVVAGNDCGDIDTVSNWARNMLLTVNADADVRNRLVWPQYKQWLGRVDAYEIYRSFKDSTDFELVGVNPGNDTTFVDDVQDLVRDNSSFCYYVKAVEADNTLGIVDASGQPMTVLSPVECTTQEARLFTATAFRPGSGIAKNQTFGPSIELADLSNYRFFVLNRWGAKVFETTDPEERWDGSGEDGDLAPQGTYVYFVRYATKGGKVQEERGTFSLIR